MDKTEIEALLQKYKQDQLTIKQVIDELKILPFEDMGFAKIDHHRMIRQGFPEVIFCQGKTVEQVVCITRSLLKHNNNILASRANPEMYEAVKKVAPDAVYQKESKLILIEREALPKDESRFILVVTEGTRDIPEVQEAACTATLWAIGWSGFTTSELQESIVSYPRLICCKRLMSSLWRQVWKGLWPALSEGLLPNRSLPYLQVWAMAQVLGDWLRS